jgi:hypothetical protein
MLLIRMINMFLSARPKVGIAHSVARWVYRSWGSDFNAGSEHNLKKIGNF